MVWQRDRDISLGLPDIVMHFMCATPLPFEDRGYVNHSYITVLTRRFGGDYLAEGSANCAAMNLILNFFRQHVISGSTASRKGAGGGTLRCISIRRPMALNLALLNDYRTCKCTMHRHTRLQCSYRYYYIPGSGSAIRNNSFLPAIQLILFNSWKADPTADPCTQSIQ